MEKANPFQNALHELQVDGQTLKYYSLPALNDERVAKLPFSIRVLLESALRNCDEFNVKCKCSQAIKCKCRKSSLTTLPFIHIT